MSKVLKAVWFLSLFGGLAGLLWTYASVPQSVNITGNTTIGREAFFYLSLFFLSVANFSMYAISKNKLIDDYEYLRSWKYTFGTIFNCFFVASVIFIALFNSTQRFDFNYFGYLIIGFLSLLGLWLVSLPFLILFNHNSSEKI